MSDAPTRSEAAAGPSSSTSSGGGRAADEARGKGFKGTWQRFSRSRVGQNARLAYSWRRPLLFGVGITLFGARYYLLSQQVKKRDTIHPDTFLVWRMYDGGIVEYPSSQSSLGMLLNDSDSTEPPRVMSLFDAIRTLRWVGEDPRIKGIFADFSSTNAPSLRDSTPLGLAQIEELLDALAAVKQVKAERMGEGQFRTVAFSESFGSHGEYLLATGFDEIYTQPTGGVPLVGFSSTIPFWSKLLGWLGIHMHAEARNEYKSVVAPYTQEQLSEPQRANQEELMNDLNDYMLARIASNRFAGDITEDSPASFTSAREKVRALTLKGPLTAQEAVEAGLLTGFAYKGELIESLLGMDRAKVDQEHDDPAERVERLQEMAERNLRGFYHYAKVKEKELAKAKKDTLEVGVVYVLGTIGDVGEFGTASIVRGLREAAEDDNIGAVILRIDTGGGGVIESDTIWGAVNDLRTRGKIVVSSFGNVAASGGYLIATHSDLIVADASTITGSIGVAGLRPTVTDKFFDKFKLTIQSFFTGSKSQSIVHELEGEDLERHAKHIDETYQDFKNRVVAGRWMSQDVVDLVAGGRVFTAAKAFALIHPTVEVGLLKGPTVEEEVKQATEAAEKSLGEAEVEGQGADHAVVHLDEDQETSPYAPPAPADPAISDPAAAAAPVEDDAPAVAAFGRGIVDAIGGIHDAAVYAVEIYLAAVIEQEHVKDPSKSRLQILRDLMPGVNFQAAAPDLVIKAQESEEQENDGLGDEVEFEMELRLKKFPVPQTFWQQIREASNRGDALNSGYSATSSSPLSFFSAFFSPAFLKLALATWCARTAAHLVDAEIDATGLSDLRKGLKEARARARAMGWEGPAKARRNVRAEIWPGISFR